MVWATVAAALIAGAFALFLIYRHTKKAQQRNIEIAY